MAAVMAVPLTQAVTSGDANAVRAAIASGADVNQRNNGGQTVLILAVIFSHTEIVRLLVKAGADPRLRDNLGLDAVEWAQRRGLNDIVDLFTNNTSVPEPAAETDERSRKWLAGVKQRIEEEAAQKQATPPVIRAEPKPEPPEPPDAKPEPKPEFDFTESNIVPDSFRTYRLARDQKPTKLTGVFRDADSPTLKQGTVYASRDALVDLLGRENPGG